MTVGGEEEAWAYGAADLFIIAEEDAREIAYSKHMAMTEAEMQAASGKRADYRRQVGAMLMREQKFRK